MNYKRIYDDLIGKAQSEDRSKGGDIYYEAHHIIPKCMGGEGLERQWKTHPNIILLTAREHFVAHLLLASIYPDNTKIQYALNAVLQIPSRYGTRYLPSSRLVASLKEYVAEAKNSSCWVNNKEVSKKIPKTQLGQALESGWLRGRHTSPTKGLTCVKSPQGVLRYVRGSELQVYLQQGWSKGNLRKGEPNTNAKQNLTGRVCVHNGAQTRRVLQAEADVLKQQGWVDGYHYKIDYSTRDHTHTQGRVCVHRGREEKRIKIKDLESYVAQGWKRGHLTE